MRADLRGDGESTSMGESGGSAIGDRAADLPAFFWPFSFSAEPEPGRSAGRGGGSEAGGGMGELGL